MRLSERQRQVILSAVKEALGEEAKVLLFGSRVDDKLKGGDIDLYVQLSEKVDRPALMIATLQAKIIGQLGEQKIDVLLSAPNLTRQPIHEIAEQQGILL